MNLTGEVHANKIYHAIKDLAEDSKNIEEFMQDLTVLA
jgi:hypothetical protein